MNLFQKPGGQIGRGEGSWKRVSTGNGFRSFLDKLFGREEERLVLEYSPIVEFFNLDLHTITESEVEGI